MEAGVDSAGVLVASLGTGSATLLEGFQLSRRHGENIHGVQRMTPNYFGDSPTLLLVPSMRLKIMVLIEIY